MNRLLNGMRNATNVTRTENDAVARETTGSELLDFFSQGGALRGNEHRAETLFGNAWSENKLAALKLMFYFRDVRGGQGQRQAFRVQLKYLTNMSPDTVRANMNLLAEYGRWDDLYTLVGTQLEAEAFALMRAQLKQDVIDMNAGKSVSLLAKWLKSENASSKETKVFAVKTRKAFRLTSARYRKILSALRKYVDVLERKMSANDWYNIDYSKVPSNAMLGHLKAFYRHDEDGMLSYMSKVNSGEAKINVKTVYPYEIISEFLNTYRRPDSNIITAKTALWDNLPDYIQNSTENSIAVVDTSGSMNGTPMEVAVSIGMYLAERAKGAYKDHFITFSEIPKLQKIVGNNLYEKVDNLSRASWDFNTNIEAVFNLILKVAVRNRLSQDEMLTKVYIISDMEFDRAIDGRTDLTLFEGIQEKFARYGYKTPQLIFWNVDARNAQYPMSLDARGFLNVSGFSPSIFENLMHGNSITPESLMYDVIDSKRYEAITI